MSDPRRLSLSYLRIFSRDAVTKLARPSKCQICLCKNDIGDLTHNFGYPTLGMQCCRSNNPPYLKNTKLMHILIGLLNRTLRKKSASD